jgi:formylglycine-generating enzyme required for sulfatase activity
VDRRRVFVVFVTLVCSGAACTKEPRVAAPTPPALAASSAEDRDAISGRMVQLPAGPVSVVHDHVERRFDLDTFFIDVTEVTVAAYDACVADGASGCTSAAPVRGVDDVLSPIYVTACNWGHPERARHPINCVGIRQARTFCAWAGKRLPREIEWEYAAGGLHGTDFAWGTAPPDVTRLNGCGRECAFGPHALTNDAFATTAPVGSFPKGASPEGVHDLAGNVDEWVEERVLHGGAWTDRFDGYAPGTKRFRRSHRGKPDVPDGPEGDEIGYSPWGFRCARSAGAPAGTSLSGDPTPAAATTPIAP